MSQRDYALVDVFGVEPLSGNPVAVVFDAEELTTAACQRLATWFNLSETVFVGRLTPAGVPIRIFTPTSEVPFAGHPTVGTAYALVATGRMAAGDYVLGCARGPVTVHFDPDGTARLRLSAPTERAFDEAAALAAALGGVALEAPRMLDAGPVWMTARLPSLKHLYALQIDEVALTALSLRVGSAGATLYAPGSAGEVHVRSLAPAHRIPEDPVCGSGNLCVAWHRHLEGGLRLGARHIGRQGRAMRRDGRVEVDLEATECVLGGRARVVARGVVDVAH